MFSDVSGDTRYCGTLYGIIGSHSTLSNITETLRESPILVNFSITDSAAEWLRSAINNALAMGVTRREIFTMVATAPPPSPGPYLAESNAPWTGDPANIVYDEVPAGLLTLAEGAKKYGVRYNTLSVALFRGMIPKAGRIRGHGHSGLRHLVSEAALRRYLGLPPEEVAARSDASPEAQPRLATMDRPIYDELPEGLIRLTEAATEYGIPSKQLHRWLGRQRLTHMGYLRGPTPQGGYVLLVEAELAALMADVHTRDESAGSPASN